MNYEGVNKILGRRTKRPKIAERRTPDKTVQWFPVLKRTFESLLLCHHQERGGWRGERGKGRRVMVQVVTFQVKTQGTDDLSRLTLLGCIRRQQGRLMNGVGGKGRG